MGSARRGGNRRARPARPAKELLPGVDIAVQEATGGCERPAARASCPRGVRPVRCCLRLSLGLGLLLSALAASAQTELNGDLRLFLFAITDELPASRQDAELGVFRLKLESFLTEDLRVVTHGVVGLSSPPDLIRTSVVSGGTQRLFDLEHVFLDEQDLLGVAELDRLYLRWDRPSFRLTAGRQAVTWGVNFFWPVLDLFAPFTPEQIDRDYKAGVDALRLTVAAGDFSQVDVILAGQGRSFPDDFSLASLGRLHAGGTDLGFMAGSLHTDTVLGLFFTGAASGTGLRGEVSWTRSGDERDAEIDRERFVRATVGTERQLTPVLLLTAELAWNGYGADDSEDYPKLLLSDRVLRGEVSSVGQRYAGLSLSWQTHPLWTLGGALLYNGTDRSALVQPVATWSVTDDVSVLFGAIVGLGSGSPTAGSFDSEYGIVPTTLWSAGKWFF